ncbi:hypothetical protein [Haliscomenobacter hydrossis]|uniref:Uncharacterized protein n=1 Tax=Haliscomenobacter hydrossis (strain ATCC 27775 / DSM 1100 / LMG 10767 / O) TaxID=760192 RepID=F4KZ82_HALH1|nr:hypothetical protein [Haliscomenobacter hydrossis]AEE53736.1 hypothetical protein Halhy_5913 [Haliscomenobacter hydrossis DSM 1100]
MEISFKNVAAFVLVITAGVMLGIILADKYMYNKELRRQQRQILQNGPHYK